MVEQGDNIVSGDQASQEGKSPMTYGERFDNTFGSNGWPERPGKEKRTTFQNPLTGTLLGDLINKLRLK